MTVVVVGSLHYDVMVEASHRPRKGETVTGDRWYPKFGGKGGNQAVAAALAGSATRFVGAVGQDDFADLMLSTLQSHEIETGHVATVAGHGTGMSAAIMDAEGDYGAVIVSGANMMIDTAQFASDAVWREAQILILQNEIPENVNIGAARAARQRGVHVCFNAAPWRPMTEELLALIDILVVNAIEAEDMSGIAVDNLGAAQKAATYLTDMVPTVIVTAGGDGVAWAERGKVAQSCPARPVNLVSTHGAGDIFIGTLCHVLTQGTDLRAGINSANDSAALHISKPRT